MGAVGRVLLDESLLCGEDVGEGDTCHLLPGAAMLLRRLQYSKLRGICFEEGAQLAKVNFLLRVAAMHSFESVCRTPNFLDNISDDPSLTMGSSVYAASKNDMSLYHKLWSNGWKIILTGEIFYYTFYEKKILPLISIDLVESENLLFIEKLEELLITLCRFKKMVISNVQDIIVGYVMKPSPFIAIFLLFHCREMQVVDAVLHKATDEIIRIDLSNSDFPKGITYSKGMEDLERYMKDNPQCCIIDPLNNVCPLLDRFRIQQILHGLDDVDGQTKRRIRAPKFLKVDDFHDPELMDRILESNLSFPCIVKPQTACGVAYAHNMALVFKGDDFENLHVPLPAIVQEYVDHGSTIYKVYVLGEKVFYAVKKSMPNANILLSNSEKNACAPILFDSLKSLPIEKEELPSKRESVAHTYSLDIDLINNAADWLRRYLDLTIFGFDVVIQEGSGDHVIVDVNYLPSFKEVPNNDAIPAFWDAIKNSYMTRKLKSTSPSHFVVS
ncbi:unnamed protein product [Spirodela intermedia]|uniref:Inositol-tetrakisphosphate 1-kinase 6 n=1 Tax=Spirodela intermedia TaxID=51605 RepID=A0A7I8JDB7_SPIIN|nr:unnamed protein product [Spirodela intermedia]CAA6668157.1 unnamed protein product [Spirodela intermedia]